MFQRVITPAQAIERHASWAACWPFASSHLSATMQQRVREGSKIYDHMLPGRYIEDVKQRHPEDYALLCKLTSADHNWIAPWRVKQIVDCSKAEPTFDDHIAPFRAQYGNVPRGVR